MNRRSLLKSLLTLPALAVGAKAEQPKPSPAGAPVMPPNLPCDGAGAIMMYPATVMGPFTTNCTCVTAIRCQVTGGSGRVSGGRLLWEETKECET